MNDNHSFLAKKYKKRAKYFGIGAFAFTIQVLALIFIVLKTLNL